MRRQGASGPPTLTPGAGSPKPARFLQDPPELRREADLSTLPPRAQTSAWLSRPHGDQERPEGGRPPPRPGPQAPDRLTLLIERLKKRADFLAAAKGRALAAGAVLTQARKRGDQTDTVRLGFTATRRIGGAVARNRAKRRLREAARQLAPLHALAGCDYVFIARQGTVSRPWARLLDDMKSTLQRLAAEL